jgi:hypothetical protein
MEKKERAKEVKLRIEEIKYLLCSGAAYPPPDMMGGEVLSPDELFNSKYWIDTEPSSVNVQKTYRYCEYNNKNKPFESTSERNYILNDHRTFKNATHPSFPSAPDYRKSCGFTEHYKIYGVWYCSKCYRWNLTM